MKYFGTGDFKLITGTNKKASCLLTYLLGSSQGFNQSLGTCLFLEGEVGRAGMNEGGRNGVS